MWLILGSVLIGLSSSAIVAFAYIMQKKAYLQIAGTNRKVYKTCTWLIGFCLMFFGSLLSLATLAVLDQTTLTSMSGSTLIFSTIFSRVFLKEPCTSLVLVQVCLLLIGASLMLIFSSKEMKEFNLQQLIDLYQSAQAATFLIAYTIVFVILTLIAVKIAKKLFFLKKELDLRYQLEASDNNTISPPQKQDIQLEIQIQRKNDSNHRQSIESTETFFTQSSQQSYQQSTKSLYTANNQPRKRSYKKTTDLLQFTSQLRDAELEPIIGKRWRANIPLIVFPWFGGFLCGTTSLYFKTFFQILKTSGKYQNFNDAFPFVIIVAACISATIQLIMLNQGLRFFNAIDSVPIYQSSVILHNILCGGIVLNQFSAFKSLNIILFGFGSLLVIVGIFCIVIKKKYIARQKKRRLLLQQQQDDSNQNTSSSISQSSSQSSSYSTEQQSSTDRILRNIKGNLTVSLEEEDKL